jgi:hypothetical protein
MYREEKEWGKWEPAIVVVSAADKGRGGGGQDNKKYGPLPLYSHNGSLNFCNKTYFYRKPVQGRANFCSQHVQ